MLSAENKKRRRTGGIMEGSVMTEMLRNMNDRELFCVLTGSRGIMAQTALREILMGYRTAYGKTAGLSEMVRTMTD